ncbi:hypothetical protein HOF92_15220 [bacterium]|jgi:hypothetical protein|nr:hypothetical protein [bacterium]
MQKRLFLFGFLLLSFSLSEAEVNAGSGLVLLRKIQEKIPKEPPLYEEIKDSSKLATIRGYLDNERARTAISLYRSALEFSGAKQGGLSPDSPYYIAIQEGGNHASSGFRLLSGGKIRMMTDTPFIMLGFQPHRFQTTFLHETGHVLLGVLGKNLPEGSPIASIPHSTAALSDRWTAFNEGFSIALETFAAHYGKNHDQNAYYRNHTFPIGDKNLFESGFFQNLRDFWSYSQNWNRYSMVRDNHFSFQVPRGMRGYLNIQLSPDRDRSAPRSTAQLLISEGFHATFFFRLISMLYEQDKKSKMEELAVSLQPLMKALQSTFQTKLKKDAPYLLHFVISLATLDSNLSEKVLKLLFQLSHGAFGDNQYAQTWKALHQASVEINFAVLSPLEKKVRESQQDLWLGFQKDPNSLLKWDSPIVRTLVADLYVTMPVVFGARKIPLSFDLNTVQPNVLREIEFLNESEVERICTQRSQKPYDSSKDFQTRSGLNEKKFKHFTFE